MWIWIGLMVVVFCGVAVWLWNAPEGYEDQDGFHYGSDQDAHG